MTIVQPMHFDVGTNEGGKGVIYVIGSDAYLYVAELKENPDDMVWAKSKKPAASSCSIISVMKVYKNVVYLCISNVFYVTENFGQNWNSYPIILDTLGAYFDACMHVEDEYIMLGSSGVGVIKSEDGGKNWHYIDSGDPRILSPQVISSNEKFVAIGGDSELIVSLKGSDKWKHFSYDSVPDGFLRSPVWNIAFEDRASLIYSFQEDGVSYGIIGTNGNEINIEWKKPFTNIVDYFGVTPGSTDYFIIGPLHLFYMRPGDKADNQSGTCIVYSIRGDGSNPSMIESSTISNPYAQFSGGVTKPRLRRLSSENCTINLSILSVLSVSYGNKPWRQIIINF